MLVVPTAENTANVNPHCPSRLPFERERERERIKTRHHPLPRAHLFSSSISWSITSGNGCLLMVETMVHRHVPPRCFVCARALSRKDFGSFCNLRDEKIFEICLEKIWWRNILLFDLIGFNFCQQCCKFWWIIGGGKVWVYETRGRSMDSSWLRILRNKFYERLKEKLYCRRKLKVEKIEQDLE